MRFVTATGCLFFIGIITIPVSVRSDKDLEELEKGENDVDRLLENSPGLDQMNYEASLTDKYLNQFATPTKYIAYALGYYNFTIGLESRIEALLDIDYATGLTTSTTYVLKALHKILEKLKYLEEEPEMEYYYKDVDIEDVKRFVALTEAIYQQYDETKSLIEKDFKSVNKELKVWLESQKKFSDNWKNIIKHGINLHEPGDDQIEVFNSVIKVEDEIVERTIRTLTGVYEAYSEIDRLVHKLEGRIAADRESGVLHRDYDNAYISILKLDQALFGIVQEKNKTLSKFKRVADAARNRVKFLVEEHDAKYVSTLQNIEGMTQQIAIAEATFRRYLRVLKPESTQEGEAPKEATEQNYYEQNRIEL